ncbi:MAG: prepilin-type N-terminal cleavage/methylation domain-containing protein [Steroidobacteraceae bacterium]
MSARRIPGFTLIELLVVVAIVATLLMIATPRYFRNLEKTRETVLQQDLVAMRDAIDHYAGDKGRFPENLQALVAERYLKILPKDPVTGAADTWVIVDSDDPEMPGIRDVRSGAEGVGPSGTPFAEL